MLGVGQGGGATAAEIADHVAFGGTPRASPTSSPSTATSPRSRPQVNAGNLGRFFKPAGFGVAGRAGRGHDHAAGRRRDPDRRDERAARLRQHPRGRVLRRGLREGCCAMFQMDVLRHTRAASSRGSPGRARKQPPDGRRPAAGGRLHRGGAAADDRHGRRVRGHEGAEIKQDLLDYVDGINAYIADVRGNLLAEPGEYALLGQPLEDWKPTDTAAIASLIGGIFGRGGGAETRRAAALSAARARFGRRRGPGAGRLPLDQRPRGSGHHATQVPVPRPAAARRPAGCAARPWRSRTRARCRTTTRGRAGGEAAQRQCGARRRAACAT